MKSLNQYMREKLAIREDKTGYNYYPKTSKELRKLIENA